ncbi:MAG: hypothetical protein ACO22T_02475 [Burkholderiales bacterium]
MVERPRILSAAGLFAGRALLLALAPAAQAQKIVCWKDKSGKVVGCGDRVPPEFQQNESKTLDNRGITRQTNVSAEEAARLKQEAEKKAALKAEEDRKIAEQRRQDSALINTYTSEKEIDQRRDRELQVVDLQLTPLKASLKTAAEAEAASQKRNAEIVKSGKTASPSMVDDLARTADERKRIEARVAEKEADKAAINKRYADQKARYIELRGSTAAPAAAAPAPAAKK